MGRPIVYLIGAGPGDPGLMTVRGLECIAAADVVVYDYHAHPKSLRAARADCELIYVDRERSSDSATRAEIDALVVSKALEAGGKIVARLLPGDPFVFGRGGKQAFALLEAGVEFEIVPGVSAGIAVAAYAGIPVTQREIADDVTFVIGTDTSLAAWEHLAGATGTLCLFMSVSSLGSISARLVDGGRSADTPVALIRRGTTPHQETIVGTLADIAERAEAAAFKEPVMAIVGEVVRLRDKLAWFERKPLFGRTVVVTRAQRQASVLTDQLTELGADVIEFPTIEIVDPESFGPADEAIRHLDVYDWLVLTSVNGVERFFERLNAGDRDGRALAGLRVAAIGPATAAACRARGISPDFVPDEHVAEAVLDGLVARGVGSDCRVLLARALEAREVLPTELRALGAIVDVVPVYRTVLATPEPLALARMAEGADVITFASSSTVRHFVELTAGIGRDALLDRAVVASIGPITSATARELGMEVTIEPGDYTIPALVEAIVEHFS
jgi:uroporphyrinogen III methyltransferase/synthase